MREHINGVHNKIMNHRCTYCDFKTAFESNLARHYKLCHAQETQDKTLNTQEAVPGNDQVEHQRQRDEDAVTAAGKENSNPQSQPSTAGQRQSDESEKCRAIAPGENNALASSDQPRQEAEIHPMNLKLLYDLPGVEDKST